MVVQVVRNQAQVEKYVAGSNPSPEYPSGFQYQEIPNDGPLYPSSPNNNSKAKRIKWTRCEFKGVMTAFYQAFNEGKEKESWWHRIYIDANKLANIRRDIMEKKRLMV